MLENIGLCELLEPNDVNAEEYCNNDHILIFLNKHSIRFNKQPIRFFQRKDRVAATGLQ